MDNDTDDRTKSQLTDLFKKDKHMSERVIVMEEKVKNHNDRMSVLEKNNKELCESNKTAHKVLFGDEDMQLEGLVKSNKKTSKIIQNILIGGVVSLWFVKEFEIIDNFIPK